ncbi:hypothetical protein JA1_000046 [Spathaspora sp. JA1]|nr:hypothetical protein JA1_000046 [Spathaspora sp. JA1]
MDGIYEYGQAQVLPIEETTDDDGNAEVYKYLQSVRNEAWNGSPVDFIERGSQPPQLRQEGSPEDDDIPPESPKEGFSTWQAELLEEFSDIKQQLSQVSSPSTLLTLPEDSNNWRKFILNNEPPTIPYFVHQFEKPTKIKLLVYITKWLTFNNASIVNLSQWIWKLFLTIDDKSLLTIDEIFILRKLATKAIKIKESITEDNTSSVGNMTLDMIITIVSKYYGQLDLLEK